MCLPLKPLFSIIDSATPIIMWVSSVQRPIKSWGLCLEIHKPSCELPRESPIALPTKHPRNFDFNVVPNKCTLKTL